MPTISLCMIVKDEESILERHLRHIKEYVDEIIIVDTGSKDKTKEIAKKFTNKVYDFKWCDDFSKARNFSLSKATKDWILVLDADEFIDKPKKLKETITESKTKLYRFRRFIGVVDHKRIKDKKYVLERLKGTYADNEIKMFRKSLGLLFEGIVHEKLVGTESAAKNKITDTPIKSIHLRDSKKRGSKIEFYGILAEKAIKKGEFDYNIIQSLLQYYIHKKDFKSFNVFFGKNPSFKIEEFWFPYANYLIKELKRLKRGKEADKLNEVLQKNKLNIIS